MRDQIYQARQYFAIDAMEKKYMENVTVNIAIIVMFGEVECIAEQKNVIRFMIQKFELGGCYGYLKWI